MLTLTDKTQEVISSTIDKMIASKSSDEKIEEVPYDLWIRTSDSEIVKDRDLQNGDILQSRQIDGRTYHVCVF